MYFDDERDNGIAPKCLTGTCTVYADINGEDAPSKGYSGIEAENGPYNNLSGVTEGKDIIQININNGIVVIPEVGANGNCSTGSDIERRTCRYLNDIQE